MCQYDSNSILSYFCDLKNSKLDDLTSALTKDFGLDSLMIEFDGNLIYEKDKETEDMLKDPAVDEDEKEEIREELAMNNKKLGKTFETLKIENYDKVIINSASTYYVQLINSDKEPKLDVLKKGKPKPEPVVEEKKTTPKVVSH